MVAHAATVDPDVIEVDSGPALGGALEAQTRGEVDIQITTAKRYPRSVATFVKQATEMATLNEETAEACFYALPRDGKTIEGPSARLAEIVASAWGHMRVEARIVEETERFVTARGMAWDLQNNVAIAFEVRRRITDRKGRRYADDMVGVTGNAASSIALRNAVFKVVPSAFWRPIYLKCREVAVGNAETLANRRAKMLEYFQKLGAPADRVFALLGVPGIEDITLTHLATLKGLATAIKEGETTVDEAFAAAAGGASGPTDPVALIVAETGATAEQAEGIHAAYDRLKTPPAARLVQLKAHKGKAEALLAQLQRATAGTMQASTSATSSHPPTSSPETSSAGDPPAPDQPGPAASGASGAHPHRDAAGGSAPRTVNTAPSRWSI